MTSSTRRRDVFGDERLTDLQWEEIVMSRQESVGVAAGRHQGETETEEALCYQKKRKRKNQRVTIVVLPVCRCTCLIGFLSVWHAFRKR